MKNIIFIYNPISGEGEIREYLDQILSLYQKHNYCVTLLRLDKKTGFDPLPMLIKQTCPEHILIAGGDGTLNHLVNFMRQNDLTTPIAILPAGTANDFAGMIGMPSQPLKAVEAVITGKQIDVDLGRVGEKYFINVLSCGLMCDISQRTPTILKNTLGKLAYYFSSISELPNFRKMNITIKSEELSFQGQCLLVMIFNGRTAGSVKVAQRANITDGKLEVLIMKGTNIVHTIKTLAHFLLQRKGTYPDDVVYFQTDSLTIELEGENVATDIDGEPGGKFPLDVECLKGALAVIVPSPSK